MPDTAPTTAGRQAGVLPDVGARWRRAFAAARAGLPTNAHTTLLQIGAEQSWVIGGYREPETVRALALGAHRTASGFFHHTPPTAAELENAIHVVEEILLPAMPSIVAGSTLLTTDARVRAIAEVSGVRTQPEMTLDLETVERVFARLAAVTLGRPAAQEGLPADGEFAAALLILREVMHHLKFPAIHLRPATELSP